MTIRIIGIVSGKGGVGKTTTVANLGVSLASQFKRKVVVVDCNVLTPNLGLHLGMYYHPQTLLDVLRKKIPITQATHTHSSGADIIPSLPSSYSLRVASSTLKKIFEELEEYEFVLVDTAPGIESEINPILSVCNEVLVIANPEIPAVTDTKRTLKIVKEKGVPVMGIELNRMMPEKYNLSVTEVESICDDHVIAVIHESSRVGKSIAEGNPVVLNDPYSLPAIEFKKLAANLVGEVYVPSLVDRVKWHLQFIQRWRETKGPEKPRKVEKLSKEDKEQAEKIWEKIEKPILTLRERYEKGAISEKAYEETKEKLKAGTRMRREKRGNY